MRPSTDAFGPPPRHWSRECLHKFRGERVLESYLWENAPKVRGDLRRQALVDVSAKGDAAALNEALNGHLAPSVTLAAGT